MSYKTKKKERQLIPKNNRQDMANWLFDIISKFPEYNIVETVSQWGELNRILGPGITANPGPVDYKITPYNREIADNLSENSPILETYVIKPTQVGFTVMVLEMHIGYCIFHSIGPCLYVGGDQAVAEESFEKRVDEMIDSSGLQDLIRPNVKKRTGRGTGDRVDSKSFGGTFARAVGPNSESKAATFPMRILWLDELEKYPIVLTKNGVITGDIVKKFMRRQDTYKSNGKILGGSTPKQQATSRIEPLVEEGDKRYYNFTCPKCKLQQPFIWKQFKYRINKEGRLDIKIEIVNGVESISDDAVWYECLNDDCDNIIKEKDKYDLLLEKGHGGTAEWIPSKKSIRPFVRSYVLNGLYGFLDWWRIAEEWLAAKDDPFKLPDFVNDILGETWKESDQKPDEHVLMQLSAEHETWPRGHIDRKVLLLTLAADLQKDRIEVGLMGHGRNRQMYMIDYWVFEGNPSEVENKCWNELEEKINAKYLREDGQELNVRLAFIDSQYLSDVVDLFAERFPYNEGTISGVFPIQARETQDKLVKKFKSNIKTPVVGLADQDFKRAVYNILRKRPLGIGQFPGSYLHISHEFGPEFYQQLTAENIVQVKVKNVIKGFKILNTQQKRNESFDIVKYLLASFQFALDQYFIILNDSLKMQKRNEAQQDTNVFFDAVEQALYE